jgi:tetratricopeptide (TPR) repeat protein
LDDFDRVLELDPEFQDAYVNRAALRLESGDTAGADADIREGLALDATEPHLLCLRGVRELEQGRMTDARRSFEAALAVDPDLAGGWANLGAVLFDEGDVDEACRCLERSLIIDDDPDVRHRLELALAVAS